MDGCRILRHHLPPPALSEVVPLYNSFLGGKDDLFPRHSRAPIDRAAGADWLAARRMVRNSIGKKLDQLLRGQRMMLHGP